MNDWSKYVKVKTYFSFEEKGDRSRKMIDTVPTNVLKNCTYEIINQYPELTSVNASDVWIYNRSVVMDVLSDAYSLHSHLILDTESRISFKWVKWKVSKAQKTKYLSRKINIYQNENNYLLKPRRLAGRKIKGKQTFKNAVLAFDFLMKLINVSTVVWYFNTKFSKWI